MNKNLNHWSNYWESGNLTSLPQDFLENYDGEIGKFWYNIFLEAPENGELLDICTGNGAIALLAVAYSEKNEANLNVTAVDAAKVEIANLSVKHAHLKDYFQQINLISDCRVEEIQLASNSFDIITSQYGIEYCDWELSAKQVNRLLKPGGRFVFISHANSTDIMTYMIQEQNEYNTVKEAGLFTALARYFDKKSSYKEMNRALKKTQKLLIKTYQQNNSILFKGLLDYLHYIVSVDKKVFLANENKVLSFYHQHLFAYARLEDVIGVSLKIKDSPSWYLAFEKSGLKLEESGEILQSGVHKAGIYYKFLKPNNT